ncbi:hypothetical protein FRB95_013112 [Tulasnella sp. JGI-2019a]|nr:hypothetical protein FRB93_012722 [Tulasnella sp. JGI-2019a]KAG9034545.1 hypothetical protein FRB95_013112 [Tulasnella sp. JGI-2019a]
MVPSYIIPGLTFPSNNARTTLPVAGTTLLITDDLNSPAEFLLHVILSAHCSGSSQSAATIVTSKASAHWRDIALRMGSKASQRLASGGVKFVDPAALLIHEPSAADGPKTPSPDWLLEKIFASLVEDCAAFPCSNGNAGLIILDDLNSLEWIGCSELNVVRFLRGVQALARKVCPIWLKDCRHTTDNQVIPQNTRFLVVLLHIVASPESLRTFRHLVESCGVHIQVDGLVSGRSGAVSGEISVHPGHRLQDPHFAPRPKSNALHYRLNFSGPEYFDRGTGGGVL